MGRGLSAIQKTVLGMAAEQHPEALVYSEVFKRRRWPESNPKSGKTRFRRGEIGSRYASVRVSVSRAIRRLEVRGLVSRIENRACALTAAGIKLVLSLGLAGEKKQMDLLMSLRCVGK